MKEIPSQYAGQCVAMINEKIVATAKTSLEAYRLAQTTHPQQRITLMCVPRKDEIVTFL